MIKEIKSFDPHGAVPYDVRINSQIEKAKLKGKINSIKSQTIVIPKK